MLANLFQKKTLPDESVEWLVSGFSWILQNFGSDHFYKNTQLVFPTDKFFPGTSSNQEEMAGQIFGHVKRYSGLEKWPTALFDHNQVQPSESDAKSIHEVLSLKVEGKEAFLNIYYEPQQVKSPEVLIANFSHALAHHLGLAAATPPPCEEDQWFHMMELVAVYLGFAVMLANTAQPYRGGGCARCVSPLLERSGFLSEDEVTYALAIYCVLKEVSFREASAHLKKSLRPVLKQAMRDFEKRANDLDRLKAVVSTPVIQRQGLIQGV